MSEAASYRINEGSLPLDVPRTWEDHTIHVLRIPGHGEATASLVITREPLPVGMQPADYRERELERLRTTLPDFELRGRAPIGWPDEPGEALLTRWTSSQGPMDQITACRRGLGSQLLIFTATHATPMPSAAYEAFVTAITGFRTHAVEPPAQDPPMP